MRKIKNIGINPKVSHVRPNFLVIGAQKCGTTWLSMMMCQHPEVSKVTNKEIHFFSRPSKYLKGIEWYLNHFSVSPCTRAIGEYTPNYFWTYDENEEICKQSITIDIPKLIHRFNPDMKLIVLLRNPADRAISAFYHHIRAGKISPREKFLESKNKYGILSMGFYDIHLKNWLKYFPIKNFLILIYEKDLMDENKLSTLKKVYNHIGVDENFVPNNIFKKFNNQNSFFEIQAKYHFDKVGKLLSLITPGFIKNHKYWTIKISENDKDKLKEIYKSHNLELAAILDKKLPW